MSESFSLTNIPIPTQTPLGEPISGAFKYRVLGFNADTPLLEVAQMYCHRKSEVSLCIKSLQEKFAFIVSQEWDRETRTYK